MHLPADEYIKALGIVVWKIASLEWLVIEVIQRLDPQADILKLAPMTIKGLGEQLASKSKKSLALSSEQQAELNEIVTDFGQLPEIRNDILHARPATLPDGTSALYRWAFIKNDPRIYATTLEVLNDVSEDVEDIHSRLIACRPWLPPHPGA